MTRNTEQKMAEKFLIIMLRAVGDVLLTTPLVRALKKSNPANEIYFLTGPAAEKILEYNPYLSGIISWDKDTLKKIREQKFDTVIDFMHSAISGYYTLFSGAKKRIAFHRPWGFWCYNIMPKYIDRGYTVNDRLQILEELRKFSQSLPIYNTLCIGQMPIYNQIRQLQRRPHVVVGTPGRLKDLINRKVLQLNQFNMIVLDEADQMLDMGFIHDIKYIISFLPPTRQSLFFSATISTDVNMLIKSFVKNPVTISVKKQETVDIRQNVVRVERGSSKLGTLSTLLKKEEYKKVLVFGRTKRGVDRISKELYSLGFKVTAIHGDRTQYQRQQAIRMFKENHVSIMIATDVAARGIDIANISHVVNFDVPETYEDYIHRIGRTGRANTIGTAVTLVE